MCEENIFPCYAFTGKTPPVKVYFKPGNMTDFYLTFTTLYRSAGYLINKNGASHKTCITVRERFTM